MIRPDDPSIYQVRRQGEIGKDDSSRWKAAKLTDDGVALLQTELQFEGECCYFYSFARIAYGRLRIAPLDAKKLAACLQKAGVESKTEGSVFLSFSADTTELMRVLREHYREIASQPAIWNRVAAE